ncbi:MAG: amino acid-binding protein [Planctomycetes bacterium]|nr:amino acid-binding protein [Planctomycetota bacterium]
MPFKIGKVDVWAVDIPDQPGTLARVLDSVAKAGGNLEFVIARQLNESTSRAFFAPVKGKRQEAAATAVGLQKAATMHSIRIEGPDRPGLGALMCRSLADAGLNLRGLSAASMGKKSVCYAAFATPDEAKTASKVIAKALRKK